MTDLLLAIIAAALCYLIARPLLDNWRSQRRYERYKAAVLANNWFDPEINPSEPFTLRYLPDKLAVEVQNLT
jgi:hypothetical protein